MSNNPHDLEPVYDLLDVEHGNAFMVRPAGGGAPQIVHNCSQGLAAAVFNDVLERTNERVTQTFEGACFVGDVHDEMLFSCNAGDGAEVLKVMLEEMARPVPWWEGLVTFGEGDHGFANLERFDGTIDRASRYGCLK